MFLQAHHQALSSVRLDIMKSLSLYYYTFVDLLDLKDHIYELLTVMDALKLQFSMDIVSCLTQLILLGRPKKQTVKHLF